jgi:hypothetical protein
MSNWLSHDDPSKEGWYPTLHVWDPHEGYFPGAHYWTGREWLGEPNNPRTWTNAHVLHWPVPCPTKAAAEAYAYENDPDV